VLARQTPLASTKSVVSGSVRGTADESHEKKAPAEPFGELFVAVVALGDNEGWVQVSRGGHPAASHHLSFRRKVSSIVSS
jgi:hypothetical protein